MNDVLIIGAGAAGITAALCARRGGASVTLLEKSDRIGRKILASGNGRCNLLNTGAPAYYGDAAFAQTVLQHMPLPRLLEFFASIGLQVVEEGGGRMYPGTLMAASVLDALRCALVRGGVQLICESPVTHIAKTGERFDVATPQKSYTADAVIVACGGMAGGKLGCSADDYALLSALGHSMVPWAPALTQLVAQKQAIHGLSGLRVPALLTLCEGNTLVEAAQGEVLFTDYGVSGVCAMQLSRTAGALCPRGTARLVIDFSPMLGVIPRIYQRVQPRALDANTLAVQALLEARAHILPEGDLLVGLVPRLLSQQLHTACIPALARSLTQFSVPLVGVRGMEHAQVTTGGADTRQFSPETLMSTRVPGLYAVGEVLNVDGDCGGFNLMFAWASGLLAGAHAAIGGRNK